MLHLNRGLDSEFIPPPPHSQGATAYIQALLAGQRDLILASQRHLALVKDKAVSLAPSVPSREFPTNSHVLVVYPTDFRPKLANQLRGPFIVVSSERSTYLLRSFVDPNKTLYMHVSRLLPYIDNPLYNSSPTLVAATDFDESVIDYITSHEGTPSRPDTLRFRVNWLGQADDEATWQSYDSLKLTAALDNYIVDNLPTCPQLFHLVPPKDRVLLRLDTIGSHHTYVFSYGDHILRVPHSIIPHLPDGRTLQATAKRLSSLTPTPAPSTQLSILPPGTN
jgi:hypothetical protein